MLKSRREDITDRQIQLEDLSIKNTLSIQLAFNFFVVNYQLVHQFMHELVHV